ncbi:MAG: BMP family ABC transporter substrate-binding protein [Desulfatirhabdiaceae bacterium]
MFHQLNRIIRYWIGLPFLVGVIVLFDGAELTAQNQKQLHPGILYDESLITDIGFNRMASEGINRFHRETGTNFMEVFESDSGRRFQTISNMAKEGVNPIIGVGFAFISAIRDAAAEFPHTRFILIDAVVDMPNVQSVMFKEHEGAFLAGMLAGLSTQSKQVGFIGGIDIPPIQRFRCGYSQGVRFISSDIQIINDVAGTFIDPEHGRTLSQKQFFQGVDIIFGAAGLTGEGVLGEAALQKKLAIGVDVNQNSLYPGRVLTSVVKRVDNAVYLALMAVFNSTRTSGVIQYGLKEDGVGLAFDSHNEPLISERMKKDIRFARQLIIDGKLIVHDASLDQKCPEPKDTITTLKDR